MTFGSFRLNTLSAGASAPAGSGAWAFAAYTSTAEDYGDVVVDSSGNIYHAFNSKGSTAIGTFDIIVQKLNSSGAVQWQQHFGNSSNTVYFPSITTDGTNVYILSVFLQLRTQKPRQSEQ